MAPSLRLASLNMNLLVDLDVLLRERSVTRAAARLGVTQSAMSHSLRRLRHMLGDPLLARGPGGAAALTPRAERLSARLPAQMEELRRLLGDEDATDPTASERLYRVAATDFSAAIFGGELLRELRARAPRAELELLAIEPGRVADALERGEADAMISAMIPDRPGLKRRKLLDGLHACALRSGHPALRRRTLALDAYCELDHLLLSPRGGLAGSWADEALARIGRRRRIAMRVPWFSVAPLIVARTDLALTLPRMVGALFERHGVELRDVPLELAPFPIYLAWHERLDRDPAQQLLRDVIARVAARSPGTAPRSGGGR